MRSSSLRTNRAGSKHTGHHGAVDRRGAARLATGLVAVLVLSGACGDDEPAPAAPPPPGAGHLARSGLDQQSAVAAVCANWTLGGPDSATVNEYLFELLRSPTLVPGAPPELTEEQVDLAVDQGCRDHPDDPTRLLGTVARQLGVTQADLDEKVVAACGRYGRQRAAVAAGNWSGDDLATLVRDVAAQARIALPELRSAIERICAGG